MKFFWICLQLRYAMSNTRTEIQNPNDGIDTFCIAHLLHAFSFFCLKKKLKLTPYTEGLMFHLIKSLNTLLNYYTFLNILGTLSDNRICGQMVWT